MARSVCRTAQSYWLICKGALVKNRTAAAIKLVGEVIIVGKKLNLRLKAPFGTRSDKPPAAMAGSGE
jgi:hypothetical protein